MAGKLGSVKCIFPDTYINSHCYKGKGKFIQIKNKIQRCCETFPTVLISLLLELRAQCTLQKTRSLNGHPLFCMFSADSFNGHLVSSALRHALTTVDFWRRRDDELPTCCSPARPLSRHHNTIRIIMDLTMHIVTDGSVANVKVVLDLVKSNVLYPNNNFSIKFFNFVIDYCHTTVSTKCCLDLHKWLRECRHIYVQI